MVKIQLTNNQRINTTKCYADSYAFRKILNNFAMTLIL